MPSEWENNSSSAKVSTSSVSSLSASSSTATSPEPNANGNNNSNSSNNNNDSAKNGHGKDCALKASTMSHDPTQYVARARVTRPTPPKPSCNPMQFVQIKPCNLYQSAQQQLKKAEEIKKVKEVKKEEPEDWQNNLDNWKSSRRKRVEHIIDRVVEVKKLEQEEFDRQRRKSKTFSEMMEERGERGRTRPKLQSLDVYNEDEANDLSDLGIGTSSASGKSSISEDCETHSIVSEPAEVENLSSFDVENNSCQPCHDNHDRDRVSSPGYETSSTAPVTSPVTSPVPYEYTYEGAIEDYKSRVSKATASSIYKKPSESNNITKSMVFERKSMPYDEDNDTESKVVTVKKEDLPKVDISKKRELFEKPEIAKRLVTPSLMQNQDQNEKKPIPSEFANVRSIKDRLCSLERKTESTDEPATGILSGEITSIKERLQCLEQQKQQNSVSHKPNTNKVVAEVVAVPPLKERLSCLQNAVTKEEVVKKPIVLVDEYQLEMLKNEEIARRQLDTSKDDSIVEKAPSDDSGINTTDEKIDHDAITTEDEDEDNEPEKNADATPTHDEKVPASASVNEIEGEFDSSVSLLQFKQNINTPTVVSSVAKPIVVDVGGGSTLNKSSDENGEVNHAQNLLKMFKMAFDGDEVVAEEKITPIDVSKTIVDRVKLGNVGKQESESALQTAIAPWQSQVNRASKIPQALMRPVEPLASESKKPSFVKVASIEEILKDDFATGNIPMSKDSNIESSEVSIKQVETPRIEVEKSKIPITSANSSNERSHEMGSHLILNIDNSQQQKKSQIPVASKTQPNSPQSNPPSPSVVIRSQNIEKPSSPALARKDQNVQKPSSPALARNQNVQKPQSPALARNSNIQKPSSPALARSQNVQKLSSPVLARNQNVQTPSSPGLASNQNVQTPSSTALARNQNIQAPSSPALARHQNLQTPSSPGLASNQNVQTPSSPALARNENQKIDSPIYENMSFDADISRPSACVGLKKVVPSQNNGRIEIFNSKSMGPKPKSPEVLPRIAKSSLNGDLSSQMQSKDFQSAVDDFYKNLESWQPKIVGEQPKDSSEPVSSVEPDLSTSNDFKEEQVVTSSPTVIPKSIESEKVAMSTPKSKEIQKVNTSSLSKKSPDPLPFESCVDILKSFLAAERSYPNSYNKPEAVVSKESNQVDSRAADRYVRQETIVEVPCTKLDVKDLPDPNFIRTPCIDVDCGDKVMKDSMIAQAQIRDSLSSAGDSSPSSEITVIFKPTPGSPTPNKSSLMQIANRVASPTPARRDPLSRQQPVTEKPCLKLDVKDLPDPNFIKTPCIDVQRKMLTECSSRPNSPLTPSSPNQLLHKTNADILKQTCEEISNSPPLSPVLGREPSAEKPNFLIARVEVVETKIKVTTTNDGETAPPPVPSSSPPSVLPGSPKAKPKSAQNSKPKNIFEFLKKNFQSKSDTPEAEVFEPISVDNSKFYVPSDVIATPDAPVAEAQSNNGVNIEITKTITTDAIVEQTDDELNLSEEINEILDEEISKLVVEDAKL